MGNLTSRYNQEWALDALNHGVNIDGFLTYCVQHEYTKAVEYLLENGAKPGDNIFHTQNTDIVRLLLAHGADPNARGMTRTGAPYPILSYFIIHKNVKCAKLVLDYGANPNIGYPLHLCIECCHELVPFLIRKGVDINVSFDEMSAIGHAIYKKKLSTVRILMKHRATLNWSALIQLRHRYPRIYKKWVREKWTLVKCAVRFLGLHSRAAVTANHPLRKLARHEFDEEE